MDKKLLIEVYTEEIPARFLSIGENGLKDTAQKILKKLNFKYKEITVHYTPRRFILIINEIPEQSEPIEEEVKGPPKKACFDKDNNPTKALTGFLERHKASMEQLFFKKEKKGEYAYLKIKKERISLEEAVKNILMDFINNTEFPKRMRWGEIYTFPRPIRSFLAIYEGKTIKIKIGNIESGNKTFGHYILYPDPISVEGVNDYFNKLEEKMVIPSQEKRKQIITTAIKKTEEKQNIRANLSKELLEELVGIVEYPFFEVLEFDKEFLKLPDNVLIQEMVHHQRYIPFYQKQKNKLTNLFGVVFNNTPTDYMRKGALRVLKARFYDALFFYQEDLKIKLEDRVEKLKGVTFHENFGTMYDKTIRLVMLSEKLKDIFNLSEEEAEDLKRAAYLSKADLLTNMVYEFPELQGEMGGIYAEQQGEKRQVFEAIYEHYRPRYVGDESPKTKLGEVLSFIDKWDNIMALFSAGEIPTGSRDPFSLRRQGNFIVEHLYNKTIDISINDLYDLTKDMYKISNEDTLFDFWDTRIESFLEDFDFRYDSKRVVLAVKNRNPYDIVKRIEALCNMRKSKNFEDLMIGFKRMNNILNSYYKKFGYKEFSFKEDLLSEEAEKKLWNEFIKIEKESKKLLNSKEYKKYLELISTLKPYIDKYFDDVLVMTDDESIRNNRLGMLSRIISSISSFGDFSSIQTE